MTKLLVLKSGERLHEGVLDLARKEGVRTGVVEGIGGVDRLVLAYYDLKGRKYEEHRFNEFMEVASILGNITMMDGKPFLHAHGTFGRRDMSVVAGHVVSARVRPFLEFGITKSANLALRRLDEKTGLNAIQHR